MKQIHFSNRTHIPPSPTLAVNGLALAKRAAGERVYNLSAGEPMIDTPSVIADAAKEALDGGKTHYSPVAGIPALRDAASEWMNTTYAAAFTKSQTLVTAGGKHAVGMLIDALISPGDEALIIAPYWVSYVSQVEMAGGTPVILETREEQSWKITPADIETHAREKTKILIFNNASNPTGVLYTKEEIGAILAAAKAHDTLVISDEVYSGLVYDGETFVSCASFSQYRDHVVVVQSMSKHFAMTGWRVGYVFGDETIIKMLSTLQGQTTSGASTISQWASVAGFAHAAEIFPEHRQAMQDRRDAFCQAFRDAFGTELAPATSALYQFIPLSAFGVEEADDVAFCHRVLEEGNVAMVPGAAFGTPGYVRCSFGEARQELVAAVAALKSYLVK